MKRRTFMLGTGGLAVGASALVGSGAFTGVEATRTASVTVTDDSNAYLGLKRLPDSPNAGYVQYNDLGALELQMDENNPTAGGGEGVNPDAFSYFDDLFQVVNQGTQSIAVQIVKFGDNASAVQFYDSETLDPINRLRLDVGESVNIGLEVYAEGVESGTQLLEEMFVFGNGIGGGSQQSIGTESVGSAVEGSSIPDESIPNTEYDGPSRTER